MRVRVHIRLHIRFERVGACESIRRRELAHCRFMSLPCLLYLDNSALRGLLEEGLLLLDRDSRQEIILLLRVSGYLF